MAIHDRCDRNGRDREEHARNAIQFRPCEDRHDLAVEPVDLAGYASSGLPTTTMGRGLAEDPLFFAAPLAAGGSLASLVGR